MYILHNRLSIRTPYFTHDAKENFISLISNQIRTCRMIAARFWVLSMPHYWKFVEHIYIKSGEIYRYNSEILSKISNFPFKITVLQYPKPCYIPLYSILNSVIELRSMLLKKYPLPMHIGVGILYVLCYS